MSNPMRYIKDLEAAGFERKQAEAQVQMVLDAIEGDLVTKSDFGVFKEHVDRRFAEVSHRFTELELRLTTRIGIMFIAASTIIVALLTWLIKI
jgi:hypothetical protein